MKHKILFKFGWFKYVDLNIYIYNNRVKKIKAPSHDTPQTNTLFDAHGWEINQ
jgi:hypothetical protein